MADKTMHMGRFGDRGAQLTTLEITFGAKATTEQWRHFFDLANISPDQSAKTSPFIASFAALPEPITPGSLYFTCDVHPVENEDANLHWHLRWQTIPSDRPPTHLMDISRKVGGYPAALERFVAEWPIDRDLTAHISATYELNKRQYKRLPGHLGALPKALTLATGSTQHTLQPDMRMTAWRIKPQIGALTILFTLRTRKSKKLIVEGKFNITLRKGFLTEADDLVWTDVALLLGGHDA